MNDEHPRRICKKGDVIMKIAVFSDSHGTIENMISAINRIVPDAVFHLGDYYGDAAKLREAFPNIHMYAVAGNCDGKISVQTEQKVRICGKTFFLCHGHTFGVKSGLSGLYKKASEADFVLFGHTHKPWCEHYNNTVFLNPGTVSGYGGITCAVLQVDEGKTEYWFMNMNQGYWEEER